MSIDTLNEDDLYRRSSQFQDWTFTESHLKGLRHGVNKLATRRVQKAAGRATRKLATSSGKIVSTDDLSKVIEPLTVDEEQQLVAYYCNFCFSLGKSLRSSTLTMVTAVQYLKRFYIHNSPMQYHPKQIALSALFFASKVESVRIEVDEYVAELKKAKGLRFNFAVIHPNRGLKAHLFNLLTITSSPSTSTIHPSFVALRERLMKQPFARRDGSPEPVQSVKELHDRITSMYMLAKHIVDTIAPMTDAYFLFTPSQICFAALLRADESIAIPYLQAVAHYTSQSGPSQPPPILPDPFASPYCDFYNDLHPVIVQCADMIQSIPIRSKRDELVKFDMRLFSCLNPDTAAEKFLFPNSGSGSDVPESKSKSISPAPPENTRPDEDEGGGTG